VPIPWSVTPCEEFTRGEGEMRDFNYGDGMGGDLAKSGKRKIQRGKGGQRGAGVATGGKHRMRKRSRVRLLPRNRNQLGGNHFRRPSNISAKTGNIGG